MPISPNVIASLYAARGAVQVAGTLTQARALKDELTQRISLERFRQAQITIAKDQRIFDSKRREEVMKGAIAGAAGGMGVRVEGSVVDAMAEVAGNAAVERFRIELGASHEIMASQFVQRVAASRRKRVDREAFLSIAGDLLDTGANVLKIKRD